MSGSDTHIEVGGDVRGQIVAGDRNVVVTATGSFVTVQAPAERPNPVLRQHIELLPRRVAEPIGRRHELDEIANGVAEEISVQVYGPDGVGKSVLLRRAARELSGVAGGIIFLNGHDRDVDDLVQELFEACYDAPGYRPSAVDLRRLMAGVRVCVLVDDLSATEADLDRLLDAVPDGTVVFTSTDRSLFGNERVVSLAGLAMQDGIALLARALGEPLSGATRAAAEAAWEATAGYPLDLLRVAAAAIRQPGADPVLPRAAELPALLPRIVARLSAHERWLLAVLNSVVPAEVSGELISVLTESAAGEAWVELAERLTNRGVLIASDSGYRLAQGFAETADRVDGAELARMAGRLEHWAAARQTIGEHAGVVAALVDATSAAGHPAEAARLAKAAAPAAACSLRWGGWRRILGRGLAAAERAGDDQTRAYLAHEEGVRSLLTGNRVAAVAALTMAIQLWEQLGQHGAGTLAGHAQDLVASFSPPTAATPPTPAPATDPGTTSAAHSGSTAGQSSSPATHSGSAATHSGAVSHAGTTTTVKTGLSLTAKLMIAGVLAATVAAGGIVLGQVVGAKDDPNVPLHVRVVTDVIAVTMPGDAERDCVVGAGKTRCTRLVTAARGKEGPVKVVTSGPLPGGAEFRYWGCLEGPAAKTCMVRADQERTVCATTTDPRDAGAAKECASFTAGSNGGATQKPVLIAVVNLLRAYWNVEISIDVPGSKPCPQASFTGQSVPEESVCKFVVPQGDGVARLTARFLGVNTGLSPDHTSKEIAVWFGCEEPPTTIRAEDTVMYDGTVEDNSAWTVDNGSLTCTVRLNTGRAIWLGSTDWESWHGGTAVGSDALKRYGRLDIPPGTTTWAVPPIR